MPNVYNKGDLIRCSGMFTDAGGSPQDPTGVAFRFKCGVDGTPTVYNYPTDSELVRNDVGDYHVDVDGNQEGGWYYRYEGTGTGQCAGEESFIIRETQF